MARFRSYVETRMLEVAGFESSPNGILIQLDYLEEHLDRANPQQSYALIDEFLKSLSDYLLAEKNRLHALIQPAGYPWKRLTQLERYRNITAMTPHMRSAEATGFTLMMIRNQLRSVRYVPLGAEWDGDIAYLERQPAADPDLVAALKQVKARLGDLMNRLPPRP